MDLNFGGIIGGLAGGAAGFGLVLANLEGDTGRIGKFTIGLVTGGAVAGNFVWSKIFPKKPDAANSSREEDA